MTITECDNLGEKILLEARSWVGTPWHHNQACKGAGVDCARLYQAVLSSIGYGVKLENYSRFAEGDSLLKVIRGIDCLMELPNPSDRTIGDCLVFMIGARPGHVGICNGTGMVHADQRLNRVVEIEYLGQSWGKRLCAAFRVV